MTLSSLMPWSGTIKLSIRIDIMGKKKDNDSWEDPLEKEMATHSRVLAWRIPWTEEPGGLQSMGSQRVRHSWVTNFHFHKDKLCIIYFDFYGVLSSECIVRCLVRVGWFTEDNKKVNDLLEHLSPQGHRSSSSVVCCSGFCNHTAECCSHTGLALSPD